MGLKYTQTVKSNSIARYKFLYEGPFDARTLVDTKGDLINNKTWEGLKVYPGMIVSVAENGSLYVYKGEPRKTEGFSDNDWAQVGGDLNSKADKAALYIKPDSTVIGTGALGNTKDETNKLVLFNDSGKIDSAFLPSYIDDVIECDITTEGNNVTKVTYYDDKGSLVTVYDETKPNELENCNTGIIYLDKNDPTKSYRWTGNIFYLIHSGGSSTVGLRWQSIRDIS